MGGAGSAGGVCSSVSYSSSFVAGTGHPPCILSPVHQGESAGVRDSGSVAQRCNRAGVPDSEVLQPHVRGEQGVQRVEVHHQPLHSEQLCGENPLPDGDHPVGSSVHSTERLDGFGGPDGRLPSGSYSYFKSQVPAVCGGGQNLAVSGFMFWPHHGASGFHQGNGFGIGFSSPHGCSNPEVPGRLAHPCLVSRGCDLGEGSGPRALSDSKHCRQSGEVLSFSSSVCGLFGSQDRLADFPGFANSIEDRKVLLNSRRISVLKRAVCEVLEGSVRSPGCSDSFGSRRSSAPEVPPISSSFGVGLCGRVRPSGLGRLLPNRSSVMVRRGSVNRRCFSGVPPSRVDVLQGCGATMSDHFHSGLWSEEEASLSINVRELLAVEKGLRAFLPLLRGRSVAVFCDNTTAISYLRHQGGTLSPTLNAVAQRLLRWAEAQEFLLFPQFVMGKHNMVADAVFSSQTPLLPFLAPRYCFRRTGQALLGLKPCGKRSRGCLPKEP